MTTPRPSKGRKHDLTRLAMLLMTALGIIAIAAVTYRETSPGSFIASVVDSVSNVLMVGLGAFSVANAAITGVAKWKDGAQTKIVTSSETTVTGTAPAAPASL